MRHTGTLQTDPSWYCWEAKVDNKPDANTFASYNPNRNINAVTVAGEGYMPPDEYHVVGPSNADYVFTTNNLYQVPGIVYDYIELDTSGRIYGGHPLNAPAKLYDYHRTQQPPRRPTP